MYLELSLLLGRKQWEILRRFHSFFRFSKGDFCRKSPILTRRIGGLQPGKLLNLTEHKYYCFDIQGAAFFKRRAFLLTQPVLV